MKKITKSQIKEFCKKYWVEIAAGVIGLTTIGIGISKACNKPDHGTYEYNSSAELLAETGVLNCTVEELTNSIQKGIDDGIIKPDYDVEAIMWILDNNGNAIIYQNKD